MIYKNNVSKVFSKSFAFGIILKILNAPNAARRFMKVWASTVKDEKITRDVLFEYEHADNLDDFISLLQNVCEQMDIPTPVTTFVNFTHYVMFNNTRFKPRDFVESVDFDLLNIEAVPEKDKKKH